MGTLDDAIREHLDLKRQQGADANELERLESEAFGPPARPGDPDFPAEEPAASVAEHETLLAEPVADEAPGELFDVETDEPLPAPPADEAAIEQAPPEPGREPAEEDDFDLGEIDLELDAELEDVAPEPAAGAAEPEAEPPSEPEPVAEAPELVESELTEPEAAPDSEPPIESLDTVEHHIEEAEPPPADDAPAEPGAPADQAAPGEEGEPEGEDVLEETPEFLRDQPEDDELWFEQGEPKDFDF